MGNNNHFDQDDKQAESTPQEEQGSLREKVLASMKQHAVDPVKPAGEKLHGTEKSVTNQKQSEDNNETGPHSSDGNKTTTFTTEQFVEKTTSEQLDSSESEQGELMSAGQIEGRRRRQSRQKEQSMVRKIVVIVVVSLVVMVTILGFSFYRYWKSGLEPLDPTNDKLVQIEVPIGTSNKGIGSILEKKKIIKSGLVFTYFVKTNNLTDFKGGFYQMSSDMTLDNIAEMLKQGGTEKPLALADAQITVPEGFSIDQIADEFAKKTGKSKKDFLDLVKDEAFFNSLCDTYPALLKSAKEAEGVRYRLEGYLFPATYNFYKETTVGDLITQMVDKTNSVLDAKKQEIETSGLSTQQMLTLASLVEKEGVHEMDRRNIAQVFYNRITADMPLQSDISILYALQEHKIHLSNKDTQVSSPYNLYVNKGFGPGPFNNPSEQAIDAVLHPEQNEYLYFLADVTTGEVYFAKTYEEHLQLKEEYIDSKK